MKKVLILGAYNFPHGDAPANRLLAVAKTFKKAGYDPFVIGNGTVDGRNFDAATNAYVVDGIRYTSIRRGTKFADRLKIRFLHTWTFARQVNAAGLHDTVFVYTTQGTLRWGLKLLCEYVWKRPLIIDCMEWFEPKQFDYGRLSAAYMTFVYRFKFLCRNSNIVAITTLLADELAGRNRRVLRLPPQVDVDSFATHRGSAGADPIELFYAGNVGRKDHIGVALEGLSRLSTAERERIRFTIAGPSWQELAAMVPGGTELLNGLGSTINVVGRISRADVLRRLAHSDFTVLLRPVSRYSSAGFPSKVPESLAAGTPLLVNLTSDLGDYLTDGSNCLVVEEFSADAFVRALRRALTSSRSDLDRMSAEARQTAAENFDVSTWVEPLKRFLAEVAPQEVAPQEVAPQQVAPQQVAPQEVAS